MNEHKKSLIKLIEQTSYKHSTWQIFSDFVELSALSISNSIDKTQWESREKRYLEIIQGYDKKERELFPTMLSELVKALEYETTDILGEIFMELNLGNKWKGQFFTPMSVCKACAAMTMGNAQKVIEEKGFITLNEPASGGGAMVIAVAEELKKQDINYQQSLLVTAQDIDIKAVHMCYLQFSLLGIPAIVLHANTLTVNVYSAWRTPAYILGGWWYRKQKEQKKVPELQLEKDGQYSMFGLVS